MELPYCGCSGGVNGAEGEEERTQKIGKISKCCLGMGQSEDHEI